VHLTGQIDEGNSSKLEHPNKSSYWSAFNWLIHEGSSLNLKHLDKSNSWSAFNWQINENSFFKLEHPDKSSSWNAFNWPIDESIFPNFGIVPNQVLVIVNNKINYLATFESCIF
jgi:hypothetical protein